MAIYIIILLFKLSLIIHSPPPLSLIAKVPQFFENFTILSFTMTLSAHMHPYSYIFVHFIGTGCYILSRFPFYFSRSAPHIDLHGSQEVHPSQTAVIRLHLAGDTTPFGRPPSVRFPGGREDLSRVTFQPLVRPGTRFPHI